MADSQTSVAINIGSQRVSMAVFDVSKNGGLVLKGYDSEPLAADPSMDAARLAQTRAAVAELAKRLKVPKGKARYAIPGQAVFTRFVKLPPIQEDNVEQLVTFEAQQHVPFPLNEVVWDYELLQSTAEKEAVIVAIKSDALDDINAAVNESGLGTAEVDVAPMAIYNAFRATYGAPEEPILLIDIGARTSNLLYMEGNRFFTRSIAIGGASVTAAIAKEYNVSFMEAEHQKIANGLVALGGGHTEQLDEAVAALAMSIRNALSRLPSEISRTTNFYRSQHGGSAPKRVILAGGGANLPYTLEFFQEKLNLPVEFFNPVRNVTIAKHVDAGKIQREGHMMGELVGLGLRGVGKSLIHIDLVPGVVEQARAADRRKPFFVAAAAVLLGGMAAWALLANSAASKAEEQASLMEQQRDKLAPLKSEVDALLKKEETMRSVAKAYTSLEDDHAFWPDLLAELRNAFASEAVWLTELEPIHGYDPLVALDPKTVPGKTLLGKSVVRNEFAASSAGTSSLADIQIEAPQTPARGRKSAVSPAATQVTANAIRIRGFWRENPKSQTLVYELIKNLRAKSTRLRFTIPDPQNPKQEIDLVDDKNLNRILTIASVAAKPGDLAQAFELTIPLSREVPVK